MKKASIILCSLFTLSLGNIANAEELKEYSRKYVSFFLEEENAKYEKLISEGLDLTLSRFDFKFMGKKSDGIKIESFLGAIKDYQKKNAGKIIEEKGKKDLKFGDVVLSLSDTKTIADSAYVFSPKFTFSEITVSKPYTKKENNQEITVVAVESKLICNLQIYKLTGDTPTLYSTVEGTWNLKNEVSPSEGSSLSKVQANKYFSEIALSKIQDEVDSVKKKMLPISGLGELIKAIKKLDDFILMGQVSEGSDMFNTILDFGSQDTPKALGIKMDNSFKVFEDKDGKSVEIGFLKARQINDKNIFAQSIMSSRNFEMGDQVKEYPQMGLNVVGKLGLSNFTVGNESKMVPHAILKGEYNIAEWINLSETYATFTSGIGLPINSPLGLWNAVAEIGIEKKLYLGQFVLSGNISGGGMKAFALGSNGNTVETELIYGGTALLGAGWQFNPDLLISLDAGYRLYPNINMSSNGLIFNLSGHYSL